MTTFNTSIPGLKQNWRQFSLLVLINVFVGGMVGLERTILPEIAETDFGIAARSAIFSFIVVFGITKAVSNYFAGRFAQQFSITQGLEPSEEMARIAEEWIPSPSDQDSITTTSSSSSFRTIGFLQQQFTYNTNSDDPMAFSIYRARIGIAGEITDQISVNIVAGAVEPPDRAPHLVNVFVDFDIDPLLNIRTGQFLVPFGLEGPEAITFNPAIERSLATRRLNTVNMFRDIGIQANGSTGLFNYAVALVNGTGANTTEQINPKDLLGRIGLAPIENLGIGLSGHLGTYLPGIDSESEQRRFRAGTDFRYQSDPLLFRGEFIIREEDLPGNRSLSQQGGYLLGAYHVTNNWQALLRFEYHDPDTSADDNQLTSWIAGINYYFAGQTRISANYEYRNDRNIPDLGDLFTMQLQIAL